MSNNLITNINFYVNNIDANLFGNLLLYLVIILSTLQVIIPQRYTRAIIWLNVSSFYACFAAFATLLYAFIVSDFSVANVFLNSNTLKPFIYKISAAWASHEGSMLMWITMISLYAFSFTISFAKLNYFPIIYQNAKVKILTGTIKVIAFITLLFTLFLTLTSNPFKQISPTPIDGLGLNPMLQDPALAIHPPLLYMGYIGCIIPFALFIATVISLYSTMNRNNKKLTIIDKIKANYLANLIKIILKVAYKWLLISWGFLTAGIFLGSLWAYYELGWGGYWSWDPVENASLLPWLLISIAIHFIRKEEFNSSEANIINITKIYILSTLPFIFSVVGALIVRSGLIESIHAFAVSPTRGAGIALILFATLLIASFGFIKTILLEKTHTANNNNRNYKNSSTHLLTRGGLIKAQNILIFMIIAFIIIGIFGPGIIHQIYGAQNSINIDSSYFVITIAPIVLLLGAMMGIVNYTNWKRKSGYKEIKTAISLLLLTIIGYLVYLNLYHDFNWVDPFIIISLWIILSTLSKFKRSSLSSNIAHIGVAICIIAISLHSRMSTQALYEAEPGQYIRFAGYQINFDEIENYAKNNYVAERAVLSVRKLNNTHKDTNRIIGKLIPENRYYPVKDSIHSETSILPTDFMLSNLYMIMDRENVKDNKDGKNKKQTNRKRIIQLYYHAYINLLWLGGLMIVLAIAMAVYNRKKRFA